MSTAAPLQSVAALSTRELDRRASWSVVWQLLKILVQMLQFVVLSRLVLPQEYGIFALLLPLYALLGVIRDGGLSTASVTAQHYDRQLASNLWLTQMALGLLGALLMLGAGPLLATLYHVRQLLLISGGLALALALESFGLQSYAQLRRELRVSALAMVDNGSVLFALAAAFTAAQLTRGVMVLVIAQLAGALGRSALAWFCAPQQLRRLQLDACYRRALRSGWHIIGADLLNALRTNAPTLIAGALLLLSEVGLLNRAMQLVNLPMIVLAPAITNFLLPLLASSRADAAQFRRHAGRTQRLFLLVTVPACVWLALGPRELLILALGQQWAGVVPLVQCLSPLFVAQLFSTVARTALLANGATRTDRLYALTNLLITLAAALLAVPFGVLAMALSLGLSALLVRTPLVLSLALRRGVLSRAELLDGLKTGGVLAVLTAAACLLSKLFMTGIGADLLGCAAAAAISGAGLLGFMRGSAPLSSMRDSAQAEGQGVGAITASVSHHA